VKSWIVRPDRFPLSVSRDTLGIVRAPTREAALAIATARYERPVIVEPEGKPRSDRLERALRQLEVRQDRLRRRG
jgi:hypothetical protein